MSSRSSHPHTRTLPWPASKIERDLLHELWLEAKASGKPITAIVKEAVDAHLNARLDRTGLPQGARAAEPATAYDPDDAVREPLPAV